MRTEDAEIALTTSFLRKSLSVCAVRSAARLLLGRLEVIGPGGAAAALRRNNALQLERRWANQRRADALCILQGRSILRRGHFFVNFSFNKCFTAAFCLPKTDKIVQFFSVSVEKCYKSKSKVDMILKCFVDRMITE